MKNKLKLSVLSIITFLIPAITFAQETNEVVEKTLSDKINEVFTPIVNVMAEVVFWKPFKYFVDESSPIANIPVVVLWLVIGAVFFTIYNKFINIKGFKHALELIRGDYDDPDDKGEVSHFHHQKNLQYIKPQRI